MTRELFMLMCICKRAHSLQLSRSEKTTPSRDSQCKSPQTPLSTTQSQPAVDTAEATISATKHSAGDTPGSATSKNVGAQLPSATESPTADPRQTTVSKSLAVPPVDNACHNAGSFTSENIGAQVSRATESTTAGAASATLATPRAESGANNACDDAGPGTSETVAAHEPSVTELTTAGAMSATLATSRAESGANNACHDAGPGTSEKGLLIFKCHRDLYTNDDLGTQPAKVGVIDDTINPEESQYVTFPFRNLLTLSFRYFI
jgi:hypothetical protein